MNRTKMSDTGEITLPKALRDAHGLTAGSEFEVIDGDREITLKLIQPVPETSNKKLTVEEFLALRPVYEGPTITDEMINEAVLKEAARRWNEKNRC